MYILFVRLAYFCLSNIYNTGLFFKLYFYSVVLVQLKDLNTSSTKLTSGCVGLAKLGRPASKQSFVLYGPYFEAKSILYETHHYYNFGSASNRLAFSTRTVELNSEYKRTFQPVYLTVCFSFRFLFFSSLLSLVPLPCCFPATAISQVSTRCPHCALFLHSCKW